MDSNLKDSSNNSGLNRYKPTNDSPSQKKNKKIYILWVKI